MSKRPLETEHQSLTSHKKAKILAPTPDLRPSDPCHISRLSDELLLHVFQQLPLEQILICQSVSQRWQHISTDPELWKKLYFVRFVQPRLAHIHSRTRTRLATRDWWRNEQTQTDGEPRKDWKRLFKIRHNWHKGRCAISEVDISHSPIRHGGHTEPLSLSFSDESVLTTAVPLVQFDGKIFFAADKFIGLRAWDIDKMDNGKRKLVGYRRFRTYEEGWKLGEPTALGMDGNSEFSDIVIGFNTGGVMILRLDPSDGIEGRDFGFTMRCILPPRQVPETIQHVTYSHPYLLTIDLDHNLSAYQFEAASAMSLGAPRLLATLRAQTLNGPCHLTLRKPREDSDTVTAAVAYSMPLFHGGWSVGIQEVELSATWTDGAATTRLGMCVPASYELPLHPDHSSLPGKSDMPVATPTSISYSHPYLLTSHRDNTLTLYIVRSTDKGITIGQPRRLWGHTTGVARAGVGGRGRAVSVSQIGGEVRVWELENIAAAVSKAGSDRIIESSVLGSVESVRVEDAWRVGKDLYLDQQPLRIPTAVEWIGFGEEKVLVLTRDEERDKNVTLYDFTV
jgi:hypothetical protein